jgi:hypothetical protein
VSVAALQLLDLASTLRGAGSRGEANRLIAWLASVVGLPVAMVAAKMLCVIGLAAGFLYWRRHRGEYELELAMCLVVLLCAYAAVIVSNFR